MSDLRELLKRAAGLQDAIANDAFTSDGTLTCQECGRTEHVTRQQLGYYLTHGWPKCCDRTMRLQMEGDE